MPHQVEESNMRLFTVPVKSKLVDEAAVQKLMQRVEHLKQNYQPEQGWLGAPENAVNRLPNKGKN